MGAYQPQAKITFKLDENWNEKDEKRVNRYHIGSDNLNASSSCYWISGEINKIAKKSFFSAIKSGAIIIRSTTKFIIILNFSIFSCIFRYIGYIKFDAECSNSREKIWKNVKLIFPAKILYFQAKIQALSKPTINR